MVLVAAVALGLVDAATPNPVAKIQRAALGEVSELDEEGDKGTHHACPGTFDFPGSSPVSLVGAAWNTPGDKASRVEVDGGTLIVHMNGRAYFGESCNEETFAPASYKAVPLLGKTFHYTTDLSSAGCGCNVAVYMTSLAQSNDESTCKDYYCDANKVCGVDCAEIDLQEANVHSWRSSLHVHDDGIGVGIGYGGRGPHKKTWSSDEYGPGAKCIDTTKPFQVSIGFPTDESGILKSMQVILSQEGKPCKVAGAVEEYSAPAKRNGLPELSKVLAEGMTPIVSYWSSKHMDWMDGKGPNGDGVCSFDEPSECPDVVKAWGFSVSDGVDPMPEGSSAAEPTPSTGIEAGVGAGGVFGGGDSGAAAAQGGYPTMEVIGAGPWVKVNQNGMVYYFNEATSETRWQIPEMV